MRVASFIVIFVFVFFLGGWFLRPHLPPVPNHPLNVFDLEFWEGNWAGAIVGVIVASISVRSAARKQQKDQADGSIVVEPLNPPRT